jgi:ribosomal protein S18 acetylase RimI-like enzyme
MHHSDVGEVVDVIARGMRDNPTHVAALGEIRDVVSGGSTASSAAWSRSWAIPFLVARDGDGTILAVLGMAAPGRCRSSARQKVRLTAGLLPLGPRALSRSLQWVGAWEQLDTVERHWHLGPVAVDRHLQGKGIGSQMMTVFCAQMDAAGATPTSRPTSRRTCASTSGSASRCPGSRP